MTSKLKGIRLMQRPWKPQDLIDDLQLLIDEEPDGYLNDRRTTLCMARDFLKEHFAAPRWISVEERLPEPHKLVLVYRPLMAKKVLVTSRHVLNGYEDWSNSGYDIKRNPCITHWMPLPEPPEEVNDG